MPKTREDLIYLAYKSAAKSRRKNDDANAEVLAIVDVSEKLRISPIFVMNLVKSRDPKSKK